jgi:hypothetical protein
MLRGAISMCTYCATTNYRKIYENHIGPIPRESNGRTYEIHHIDGNHSNNDPTNLTAVTIQEHYNIHYTQGDWAACRWIKIQRMEHNSEELFELNRAQNLKRVADGTHNFLGSDTNRKRIENGTHHLLGGELQRKRVTDGTHHFLHARCSQFILEDIFFFLVYLPFSS